MERQSSLKKPNAVEPLMGSPVRESASKLARVGENVAMTEEAVGGAAGSSGAAGADGKLDGFVHGGSLVGAGAGLGSGGGVVSSDASGSKGDGKEKEGEIPRNINLPNIPMFPGMYPPGFDSASQYGSYVQFKGGSQFLDPYGSKGGSSDHSMSYLIQEIRGVTSQVTANVDQKFGLLQTELQELRKEMETLKCQMVTQAAFDQLQHRVSVLEGRMRDQE